MGAKKKKYMSYKQAREIVQEEQIPHREGYWRWYDWYKPNMPKYPDDVYEEWTSWNDFLGNNNKFKVREGPAFRTYEEAMLWGREQGISGFKEWMVADLPPDIPRRPDVYYRGKFTGWKSFLGTGKNAPANIVEGAKAVEKLDNILLIGIPQGEEIGVITATVHLGMGSCKDFLNKHNIRFVKAFYLEDGYDYISVLKAHGEEWGEQKWRIRNINAMLFDINLRWVQ